MKILEEGHFEDKMQVRCPACEARLEITSKDVQWEKTLESVWGKHFFICGFCNYKNYFRDSSEMTRGVRLNLKR